MPAEFEVRAGREFERTANALRRVDAKMPGELRKQMRKTAQKGVKVVKTRVRTLPVAGEEGGTKRHPHKRGQLRRRVARGVSVRASTGGGRRGTSLRIVTKMPREEVMLPRGLDSLTKHVGWKHPVYGQRDVPMVVQPGWSWFVEPLGELKPELHRDLQGVLDDARDQVRRAGGGGFRR